MNIRRANPEGSLMDRLPAMSAAWEAEQNVHGYCANGRGAFEKCEVFVAEEAGEVIGYLLSCRDEPEEPVCTMPEPQPYLEIDEIYVVPAHRGRGAGRALYMAAEEAAREAGLGCVILSTAMKDWKKILHLYIEELGMEFWTARLFKRL